MKTVILLMLGLIVSTASFAKSGTTEPLGIKTRLTLRNGNVELAIQQKNTNALVKFYDERGFVLYQFKYNLKKGISQRFDVSELAPGNYKIEIEVDGEFITKEFSILIAREQQTIQVKDK